MKGLASVLLSVLVARFGGIEGAETCPPVNPVDYDVLIADPTDCSKFYRCSNGIPYIMTCPGGLYFNDVLKVCDYPQEVNCMPRIGGALEELLNETLSATGDLLFVLDESIGQTDFNKTREFVKNVVSKFPLSTNRSAGVITFSLDSLVRIHLTENTTSSFLSKVNSIQGRGGIANILSGLQTAQTEIQNYCVHNLTLVFLITRGISLTPGYLVAEAIKRDNNSVVVIQVGELELQPLRALASTGVNNTKNFFHVQSYDLLDSIGKYINGSVVPATSQNVTALPEDSRRWTHEKHRKSHLRFWKTRSRITSGTSRKRSESVINKFGFHPRSGNLLNLSLDI